MFRYKTLQRPSEKTFQNPTALFIIRSERMQYARKGYLKIYSSNPTAFF